MLERIEHDRILELKLARPPVNALNRELLTALRSAIVSTPEQGFDGLFLSGGESVFSAGLDVPELLTLDRDELEASWRSFFAVCQALAESPIPGVAAIGGHSPAGGAVLSLFCDYRVMVRRPEDEKPAMIGLNETQVGLVVPECIQYVFRRLVGHHTAERLLVAGAMIDAGHAFRIGMVDELAEPGDVEDAAKRWLQSHLALPQQAMQTTRKIVRADIVEAINDPDRLKLDVFLDAWFGKETQAVLHGLVARLKGG
ncbi:MAG: enoyl-CoA hydratase/isomerase family protein [Xanthomonadales bacterium]|nr:enoyl-CoA hydratase/isomerase family protein [Xanthomonadales bacterium]